MFLQSHTADPRVAPRCAAQIFVPYRAALGAGGASPTLRRQVLQAAAARFARFEPRLGRFGGFPTGKKALPDPK